jgi:F-type H+-transporting ATPase subunit gamma
MASGKEIRNKIKSVENTRKITKAMEMVAASKMRKAQDRMRAARPYGEKIRRVAANLSHALSEYKHPFLIKRDPSAYRRPDSGHLRQGSVRRSQLQCLRMAVGHMKDFDAQGKKYQVTCIGNKGFGFMQRMGGKVVSHITGIGDTPHLEKLIGPVKVQLDAYLKGEIDALYIGYTRFINTMKQEPVFEQLLPSVRRGDRLRQVEVGLCL